MLCCFVSRCYLIVAGLYAFTSYLQKFLVKAQGSEFLALSAMLHNWNLNNRRMLLFYPDRYPRLVL